MMLPTLISVSVAPGSYFFSALAALPPTVAASKKAVVAKIYFHRVLQAGRTLASGRLFDFLRQEQGSYEIGHAPVDQKQRASDHQRTHDLAKGCHARLIGS